MSAPPPQGVKTALMFKNDDVMFPYLQRLARALGNVSGRGHFIEFQYALPFEGP
jgi:hypothetical protein